MNKLEEINAHKRGEIARLAPHAAELRKQALLRNDFRPFRAGLHEAFAFAIVACLIAAAASLMRGGKYQYAAPNIRETAGAGRQTQSQAGELAPRVTASTITQVPIREEQHAS